MEETTTKNAPERPTLSSALRASREVVTRPSGTTFERLAAAGKLEGGFFDASRYVALAAFLAALVALPRGDAAMLGTFLSVLLGFATFAWFTQRLALAATPAASAAADDPEARRAVVGIPFRFALFWGPIAVAASVVVSLLSWIGIATSLSPIVVLVAVAANVALAFLALRAALDLRGAAIAVVLTVAAVAAYGVDRLVWTIVG